VLILLISNFKINEFLLCNDYFLKLTLHMFWILISCPFKEFSFFQIHLNVEMFIIELQN
jgi:hypothetical protein